MPVSERDYLKTPGDPAALPGWMARWNAFGEKHARVIISVSTALIIVIVLLFAKVYYDRATIARLEQELRTVTELDKLKQIKEQHGEGPLGPRISYVLANRYYEEGRLAEAENEYNDFKRRYPNDPLSPFVIYTMGSLQKNIRFEREQKEARLRETQLQTHPSRLPRSGDPRFEWIPSSRPRPAVEISAGSGALTVELLADEAPETTAAFLKLADEKYFDGVKWGLLAEGAALQALRKAEKPSETTVPREDTGSAGDEGALLLVAKEGKALPAEFRILVKPQADLKDATVFGLVTEGLPLLKGIQKDDAIKTITVIRRRSPAPAGQKP